MVDISITQESKLRQEPVIKIRWLTGKDKENLKHLIKVNNGDFEYYYVTLDPEMLDDYDQYFIGIFKDQELIGICSVGGGHFYDHRHEECLLSDVYISMSERRKGYGTRLIQAAIELVKAKEDEKWSEMHITILDDALAAFYLPIGFKFKDSTIGWMQIDI